MLESDKNKDILKDKQNQKKRLGRGLGSLFTDEITETGMVQEATGESEESFKTVVIQAPVTVAPPPLAATESIGATQRIWTVAIEKIIPNRDQPRKEFDIEKLKELAASIKEQGILQPIVTRRLESGEYEIIAGERRWRAAQLAGVHEIPVILKEADNRKVLEWALIENIQREDLNPIEESEAYNLLIGTYHYTHQELADKMGKERATISNSLRLLTLSKEVRELIREQKISAGHAKVLLSLENLEQQRTLARDIVTRGLSVRAVEKEVSFLKKGGVPATKEEASVSDRLVENMAEGLQKVFGTKVKIDYADGKGRIVVQFYTDEGLTDIVAKMKGNL
jgi:ParB family transcriptional regulator, chromosome partitioning protein